VLEELIRESLTAWRPDIAERLNSWLDERLNFYRQAMGQRKLQ
jgi:hypothetical protein